MLSKITCSRVELADVLNLSEQRVGALTKTGVLVRGPKGYDLRIAVRAYVNFLRSKTGSLTDERARLTKAQADLAELNLRQRIGSLIDREAAIKGWFRVGRQIRDSILILPDRLAGPLSAMDNQSATHLLLTKELEAALTSLAGAMPLE